LQAPGLHRYFSPFLKDPDLTHSDGVIDFVIEFVSEAMTPILEGQPQPPTDWYLPLANVTRYASSLAWDFPGNGTLDLIPAGRQGVSYATRVNSFDWGDFYDRLRGGTFLEAARQVMIDKYDYVLIDSRTGVSDTAGICTIQLPDALVACFTFNNQTIDAAEELLATVVGESCTPTSVRGSVQRVTRYLTDEQISAMPRVPEQDRANVLRRFAELGAAADTALPRSSVPGLTRLQRLGQVTL